MREPETPTEVQLRQIKWLLVAILACLGVITLAALPAMIEATLKVAGAVILVLGVAALGYAAWLGVSYLFDRVQKRPRGGNRASME